MHDPVAQVEIRGRYIRMMDSRGRVTTLEKTLVVNAGRLYDEVMRLGLETYGIKRVLKDCAKGMTPDTPGDEGPGLDVDTLIGGAGG